MWIPSFSGERGIPVTTADGFDTPDAGATLQSAASALSDLFQYGSGALQHAPGMAGAAGVFGVVGSVFDVTGKALEVIGTVREARDVMAEFRGQQTGPAAPPQVVSELILKAVALVRDGRPDEALPVYDDLVRRFGTDSDPTVIRLVRRARISGTDALCRLQRFEDAATHCGEIMERYGADPDPVVVADVLSARLIQLLALAQLQRFDEAASCSGEIDSICDGYDSGGAGDLGIRVRQVHVSALFLTSVILLLQGRPDDALAVSGEITDRFGADRDPEVRRQVARALLYKGLALVLGQNWDEAARVMSTVVARYGDDPDPVLRDVSQRARARAAALREL
jgi:hypothetical protein